MPGIAHRRIALIGGAGFVGHHLAVRLRALGATVFVIDSLGVNNYHSVKRKNHEDPHAALSLGIIRQRLRLLERRHIQLIEADARNYEELCHLLKRLDVDTIVHLAAVAHANVSNKDPYSTFDHSLRTLENALDNARSRNLNVQHFIYLSSSMVYGHFSNDFVTEESPCNPIGIYGALKFAGEKLVVAYNQVFDLPYTIIRPSALYGARCISRRVVQVFIERAIQGHELVVQGDGTGRLDFTCVDDLVMGICQVVERPEARNQIFNMTFGQSRSIGELIEILRGHMLNLNVRFEAKDSLMPDRGTLRIQKARRLIEYEPRYPLEKGVAQYVAWYRKWLRAPQAAEVLP